MEPIVIMSKPDKNLEFLKKEIGFNLNNSYIEFTFDGFEIIDCDD
jgi:hypothetical protein